MSSRRLGARRRLVLVQAGRRRQVHEVPVHGRRQRLPTRPSGARPSASRTRSKSSTWTATDRPDIVTGKMRFAHPHGYGDPDGDGIPYLYVFKNIDAKTRSAAGRSRSSRSSSIRRSIRSPRALRAIRPHHRHRHARQGHGRRSPAGGRSHQQRRHPRHLRRDEGRPRRLHRAVKSAESRHRCCSLRAGTGVSRFCPRRATEPAT